VNTPAAPPPPPPPPATGIVALWKNHGTKILGTVTAIVAAVAVWTPDQFALFGIDGHMALRFTSFCTGLLTILRGFQNTAQGKTP